MCILYYNYNKLKQYIIVPVNALFMRPERSHD